MIKCLVFMILIFYFNFMKNSERELVELSRKGNRAAQAKIVQKYERMVYNLSLRLLGSQEEAECVLQETFLKVLESLGKFKGYSQLSTWIYRIATNQALMRLRDKKREYIAFPVDDEVPLKDYSNLTSMLSSNPLDELLNSELKEKMSASIKLLSPKYKSVFILKDIEGLSLKEISEILNMSIPAVKSNLHRARLFLRDKLTEYIDEKKSK